jgi:hypothetical protein
MIRGSGGRWRVRYRIFQQNNRANKIIKNSPLDQSIKLLLFVFMVLWNSWRGRGQKMTGQGHHVPIKT